MNFKTDFESSNIAGYAFSDALYIKFKTGAIYRYPDATADQAAELDAAESKGKYFTAVIRKQRTEKVSDAAPVSVDS